MGISYARPPLKDLRWRAPKPAILRAAVFEATRFGANCYQAPPTPFGPFSKEFLINGPVSEDCLFLNIWTAGVHHDLKPVYVFIHGGGFGSGSASLPIYDGRDLASRGVVVVTLNYRLGVFGYLAHPQLTRETGGETSGNYGIQDIIAALQWVQQNISSFGGDPHLVTISGQSAGAAAVQYLLMSKSAQGLFARAVAESGSGMGISPPTLREAEGYGVQFAASANATELKSLRAMGAAELQALATVPPPSEGASARPTIRFAPNIDGEVIAATPDGNAEPLSKTPLLTGYNTDEGNIFGSQTVATAAFERDVRKRYGEFADRALALYPHATDLQSTESWALIARDRYLASMIIFSEQRAKVGQTVYDYVFDHPYPIPDSARFKAFHTAEVPYVFGALHQEVRTFSVLDHQVSTQLQGYWINFMRDGNPNTKGSTAWQPAHANSGIAMELGDHAGSRAAVSSPARLDFFRDYVAHGNTLGLF